MRDRIIVAKMKQYTEKIIRYTKDMNYESFSKNSVLVEACVFNLSQIGELTSRVSKDFETQHAEISWRQLYGLRNRIVHDYDGVNLRLVWEIIEADIPDLLMKLETLIDE